jgi:hypothetical protein
MIRMVGIFLHSYVDKLDRKGEWTSGEYLHHRFTQKCGKLQTVTADGTLQTSACSKLETLRIFLLHSYGDRKGEGTSGDVPTSPFYSEMRQSSKQLQRMAHCKPVHAQS